MNRISEPIRDENTRRGPAAHSSRKVCEICRCRLTVHQEVRGGICDDPKCRGRKAVEFDARRRQQRTAVRQMALKYRDETASRLGIGDPASLRLAVIPFYHQPVVQLSGKSRAEFKAHLVRVLRKALDGKSDSASEEDLEAELRQHAQAPFDAPAVGASCAVCTGFCCREGGTRAYLGVIALRSYMARHPGMRIREILHAYLSKLPDATCKGSCVYHGPRGCGLPREMRSSVCNNYYCGGMQGLQNEIASEGPGTVLLAALEEGRILKSAIVESDGKTIDLVTVDESSPRFQGKSFLGEDVAGARSGGGTQ